MRNASVGTMVRIACLVLLVAAIAPALAAVDSAPPPALPPADPGKTEPSAGPSKDPGARWQEMIRRAQEAKKAGASREELQRIFQETMQDAVGTAEGVEAPAGAPALNLRITAPKCQIEIWDKGQHVVYKEEDDGSVKVTVEGDGDRLEATAKDRKSFLEKYPDVAGRVGIQAGAKGADLIRRLGEGVRKKGKGGAGAEGGEPKEKKKGGGDVKTEKPEI